MLPADFASQMVGYRELQKMARDSLMPNNRPRVFNGGADVEIFARRIVSGNEIKTAVVFVVNARRIHETTRARWFESFRQLTNLKTTKIGRQGNEMIGLQKLYHLRFTAFVSLQKFLLVFRDVFAANWIWICV